MGAVSFIETMDHTSLSNITQEEFEKYAPKLLTSSLREPVVSGTLKMPSKHSRSRDRNPHLSRRPPLRRAHRLLPSIRTSPHPTAHRLIPFQYHPPHFHNIHRCTPERNPRHRSPSRASTPGGSSSARETRFRSP